MVLRNREPLTSYKQRIIGMHSTHLHFLKHLQINNCTSTLFETLELGYVTIKETKKQTTINIRRRSCGIHIHL